MANRNIAFKFINSRKVSFASLAADLAIGYNDDAGKFVGLFVVPDFLLKKSPTKGYYYQGPSKPYMKDGEHQIDDAGYKRYLEFFRLFSEKGAGEDPTKYSPTKSAHEGRKYLIGLLVDEMGKLGVTDDAAPAARAPKASTRTATVKATRPATAKTTIEENSVDAVDSDTDDDDMPF
jgi:hypothetical protein